MATVLIPPDQPVLSDSSVPSPVCNKLHTVGPMSMICWLARWRGGWMEGWTLPAHQKDDQETVFVGHTLDFHMSSILTPLVQANSPTALLCLRELRLSRCRNWSQRQLTGLICQILSLWIKGKNFLNVQSFSNMKCFLWKCGYKRD